MTSLNLCSTIQTQRNQPPTFSLLWHASSSPFFLESAFARDIFSESCNVEMWGPALMLAHDIIVFFWSTRVRGNCFYSVRHPTYNEWFWFWWKQPLILPLDHWRHSILLFSHCSNLCLSKITFELQSGDISHTRVNTNPTNGLDGLKPIFNGFACAWHTFS